MTRSVAILMFDEVEVLDFAGPFEVFGIAGQRENKHLFDVCTVAERKKPVMARNNLSINADYTFVDCPHADILVVPGGFGTRREKHNEIILEFIKKRAAAAEQVFSICSGALLLAKSGLLENLHATTHKGALAELREDAPHTTVHDQARVVDNGKIILSAGISAGIDTSLYLVAKLHGIDEAIETATYMEYDWHYRLPDGKSVISVS